MRKKQILFTAVILIFFVLSSMSLYAKPIEPPQWTYGAVDSLVKRGFASPYYANDEHLMSLNHRYMMAHLLEDIINNIRKIYDVKDYSAVSYEDVANLSKLAYEFKEELVSLKCDTGFIKDMLYSFENPPPKPKEPPKAMFAFGNLQTVYLNSAFNGTVGNIMTAYDYYNAKGFTEGYSQTRKMNLGAEFYRKDFKAVTGFQLSAFNKSGNDALSGLYGITAPERTFLPSTGSIGWVLYDSVTGNLSSTRNTAGLVNKIWYSNYNKKFYLLLGPYYPLYTNPIVFTGRKNMTLYGSNYMPLNGIQLSGESGQFFYELFGAIRYAHADTKINWPPGMLGASSTFQSTTPYNQFTQGFSIGSEKWTTPFFKRIFKNLKTATLNLNYLYMYDSTKGSQPDFLMYIPSGWLVGDPAAGFGMLNGIARIGPQRETLWGGSLYLSNFIKNIDFSFAGGRSFYSPVYTRLSDINGYAYECSLTGNYNPLTVCFGYRYITPKYSPFFALDSYALDKYHNPAIPTINSFQTFDTSNYPNNTKGVFGWATYEFKNKSILTLTGYSRSQIKSSFMNYRAEPGFMDQRFTILQSQNFMDTTASEAEWKVKYYLPYKRWTLDYTYDKANIYRNTPNFNELNQDARYYMLNLGYKLSNKFFLKYGFYDYSTKGRDNSMAYRDFAQSRTSYGLNYKFDDSTYFDIGLYSYDHKDKFNLNRDYKATLIFTEFNLKF